LIRNQQVIGSSPIAGFKFVGKIEHLKDPRLSACMDLQVLINLAERVGTRLASPEVDHLLSTSDPPGKQGLSIKDP
jgi:hypothetical protein